jgi:CheY-like chemotaxis protein
VTTPQFYFVKTITCLLIDDDADDREICLSALENISSEIRNVTATNGADALEKLNSPELKPDIIFLDLNMPLMNGRQFLKEFSIHHSRRRIPVVILSTSADKKTMAETLQLGAVDFITKPDSYSEWEKVLGKVIKTHVKDVTKIV